ncbi:MAG: hypothetical protein LWW93_12060 [Hyphomicrobiales bacterium]|nr:hypothetical protein [Hyphomicrobiales bacterium]
MSDKLSVRITLLSPAARFRIFGVIGGVLGAATSLWIRLTTVAATPPDVLLSRTKAERLALERIGGRFAVEAAAFQQWFADLWTGRALATTLLVLTVAFALVCFWIARLLDEPPTDPN